MADAGPDLQHSPLEVVKLDGSASFDPTGDALAGYAWSIVSAPSGSAVWLDGDDGPRPEFFADLAGDYVFELTVQSVAGVWDATPDPVQVTVTPAEGFYVEVSWDNDTDLDLHLHLHLLDGSTPLFESGDCNYCNMDPSWGGPGSVDDPSLDWDSIDGFGPETVTIETPADGTYDVRVHDYGMGGSPSCAGPCPTTVATARVYLGGVLAAVFSHELSTRGDVWKVAQIAWPSGQVTELAELGYTAETTCWF